MCGMGMGLAFMLVHVVMILVVSFFVLVVARKTDGALKTFGVVLAVLLWLAAAGMVGKAIKKRGCMMHKCKMSGYTGQQANMQPAAK